MRVEGGGWKRPHFCRLYIPGLSSTQQHSNHIPSVLFGCPAPVGKYDTEIQLFGDRLVRSGLIADHSSKPSFGSHHGCNGFATVCNCCTIVRHFSADQENQSLLVVGGEDCTVKVFSMPHLRLLQETTLSQSSSMKCLSTSYIANDSSRGIVFGGGGKLQYYLWTFDLSASHDKLTPLSKVVVGTTWEKATQDHRILAVQGRYLGRSAGHCLMETFMLIMADSRGYVSIALFSYPGQSYHSGSGLAAVAGTFDMQLTFELSTCPLLCCSLTRPLLDSSLMLCSLGDTRGHVYLLTIPVKVESALTMGVPCVAEEYIAHEMGTNCIELTVLQDSAQEARCVLLSGGDDESITARDVFMRSSAALVDKRQGSWPLEYSRSRPWARRLGAAHAAFKGIKVLEIDRFFVNVVTVAYDQMLSLWRLDLSPDECDEGASAREWTVITFQPTGESSSESVCSGVLHPSEPSALRQDNRASLQWCEGTAVQVAEVSSLSVSPSVDDWFYCCISGEGFQLLEIKINQS